ncbi:MAG TPA: hypothetical protein VKF35_13390 [Hyphomicrobiaceae bacterium]|nr:hypothetical protein [Hyphomicrobiaceae bacterium]
MDAAKPRAETAKLHAAAVKPRGGRPVKSSRKGARYQIGVIVTGATKAVIAKAAKTEGRTISRQVEHMVERCLQYDRIFAAMGKTAEEIQRGNLEAALFRAGYPVKRRMIDGKVWKSWLEPGHPVIVEPGEIVTTAAVEQESK